jgi:signal transduction histidine kinase
VLGYASLIQRQPGAAEAGAWAGVIIKATKRLLALLERLLLLSRLEAGALALELQPVALAGAVAETCESLEPLAAEKGLVTSCDCAADLLVRADAVYLHEVLANVVGNAIRYTPSGSVRLTAARVGDRVRISVTDTGVGFDPVLLQSPFEPFRRGPSEAAASADGAGLGLSITKGLVAQMQGSLLIESERGRGTTVTINLPAASVAE